MKINFRVPNIFIVHDNINVDNIKQRRLNKDSNRVGKRKHKLYKSKYILMKVYDFETKSIYILCVDNFRNKY